MSITIQHLEDYPLDKERVLETGETKHGYIWVTAKAPGYGVNGYVRIPDEIKNHPWQETELFDVYGDAWGGETFRKGRWHGFDTHHYNDAWDDEYIWDEPKETFRKMASGFLADNARWHTPEGVKNMTKAMAEQAHTDYQFEAIKGTFEI